MAINAGSARAFRAPGHPPASFGMESIMDELAVKLDMDPVELRIKNDPIEVRQRERILLGAERFGWKEKYKKPGSSPGPVKTGVGCAAAPPGAAAAARHRRARRKSTLTAVSNADAARRIWELAPTPSWL